MVHTQTECVLFGCKLATFENPIFKSWYFSLNSADNSLKFQNINLFTSAHSHSFQEVAESSAE